jgi:hypothetical protein
MSGVCGTYRGEGRDVKIFGGKPEKSDNLEGLGVDGNAILGSTLTI